MTWRIKFLLFIWGLAAASLVAQFQTAPGYMDADYYYAGGIRLAEGKGFTEDFLWNYLDDPIGLPHPSHAYWMPLASIVAALGMMVAGSTSFWAARLGQIFIAGLVAPATSSLAYAITRQKENSILAGLLSAVPGFYLPYLGTTDTFGIYMFLGGAWFFVAGQVMSIQSNRLRLMGWGFALGLISGLFHLSRADGITWLFMAGIAILVMVFRKTDQPGDTIGKTSSATHRWGLILAMIVVLFGYLVVMSPWMARNWAVFGTLLSPGGWQALWFTDYNELFSYPSTLLTPQHWWSSGMTAILEARWHSLGQNLQTALAVQGEIFLAPLILLGLWYRRREVLVQLGLIAWILTFVVMTLVFPFAGWRGGFFHSGAAIQPLFWAVAPTGLDVFIRWGSRVRRWDVRQASTVFRAGLVGIAVLLSILTVQKRVIGSSLSDPIWDQDWSTYIRLEEKLVAVGVKPGETVLVNNAPGYYVANRRPALSIPNGGLEITLEVAHRYGALYMLLDNNHPEGLERLYEYPDDQAGLEYISTYEQTHIFAIR